MNDVIENSVTQYDVYCDDDHLEVPAIIEVSDDVVESLYGYIDRTRVLLEEHSAIAIEIKVDVPHRLLDEDGEALDKYSRFDWNYTVLRIERYSATVTFGNGSTQIWICI